MKKIEKIDWKNIFNYFAIASGWIITSISLIFIFKVKQINEFEVSPYFQLPKQFWFLCYFSILFHLLNIFKYFRSHKRDWVYSYFSLLGLILIVLGVILLPYLKGYYSFRGDFHTYVLMSQDLALNSEFKETNFYPAIFGMFQIVSELVDLDFRILWMLAGVGTYILRISLALLIGKEVFKNEKIAVWLGVIASIPAAGTYIYPIYPASFSMDLVYLLILFLFYSKIKKDIYNKLFLIIVILIFPFLHPLVALMVLFWVSIIEIIFFILGRKDSISYLLILLISWVIWVSRFTIFSNGILEISKWITNETKTMLDGVVTMANKTNFNLYEIIELFVKRENGVIFIILFSILSIAWFLRKNKNTKSNVNVYGMFLSIGLVVIFGCLMVVIGFLGPFGELDFNRFFRLISPWGVVGSSALFFSDLEKKLLRNNFYLMPIIISIIFFAGLKTIHSSPFIFEPNTQLHEAEVDCVKWIYEKSEDPVIRGIWGVTNLSYAAVGIDKANQTKGVRSVIPEHFGLMDDDLNKSQLKEGDFLVITSYDKYTVLDLWKSANKFSQEDFLYLAQMDKYNLIYSNNLCEIWQVRY